MHPYQSGKKGGSRLKRTGETHLVFSNLKRVDSLLCTSCIVKRFPGVEYARQHVSGPSSKTHNAPLLVHQGRIEKAVHKHHTFLIKETLTPVLLKRFLSIRAGGICPCVDCA